MIKAILIDDETHCRETLSIQLKKYCSEVHLLAQCNSAAEGMEAIAQYQPDVVFLDVEMPTMNGFEMLQQFIIRKSRINLRRLIRPRPPLLLLQVSYASSFLRYRLLALSLKTDNHCSFLAT